MRIGIDFDNTIVSYDALFHKVACEKELINSTVSKNKLAVRDFLRANDQENIWIELQGYVYGARMSEAEAYPDAIDMIQRLVKAGHTLAIISHKTKYPYRGPHYDLHAAARAWVERYLYIDGHALIPNNQLFFELTKEEKIARITEFDCHVFIDDLPEILLAIEIPKNIRRFLFDPDAHFTGKNSHLYKVDDGIRGNVDIIHSWLKLEQLL